MITEDGQDKLRQVVALQGGRGAFLQRVVRGRAAIVADVVK